jgi:type II secretory pathway pseudopilin PulG
MIQSSANQKYGLSTVEFLVVIIIIMMLSALVMVFMSVAIKEANDAERKADIAQLMRILLALRIDKEAFPVEKEECEIGKNCHVFDAALKSKYVEIPNDPRGEGYHYRYSSDGNDFTLKATMSDGSVYVYDTY